MLLCQRRCRNTLGQPADQLGRLGQGTGRQGKKETRDNEATCSVDAKRPRCRGESDMRHGNTATQPDIGIASASAAATATAAFEVYTCGPQVVGGVVLATNKPANNDNHQPSTSKRDSDIHDQWTPIRAIRLLHLFVQAISFTLRSQSATCAPRVVAHHRQPAGCTPWTCR